MSMNSVPLREHVNTPACPCLPMGQMHRVRVREDEDSDWRDGWALLWTHTPRWIARARAGVGHP